MIDLDKDYEVVVFAVGETKAGTKMGKLQLKDNEGNTLNCVLWEEALNRMDEKIFRTGNIVKIVTGTYNPQYNNCHVSSLALIKEAKLGLDEAEREQKFAQITEYAQSIKNEKLQKFVLELLFEHEERFKLAPAAKLMHHNYIGGLLVHTLECLDYAKNICANFYRKVNLDKVYAACILHDFGKIFEYTINIETGLIDYDNDFKKQWISHSQWGYSNCMTAGFIDVAKMIATHHGRLEWGAIVDLNERDLEPIDYLIHHIDDLSAKFGQISIADLS